MDASVLKVFATIFFSLFSNFFSEAFFWTANLLSFGRRSNAFERKSQIQTSRSTLSFKRFNFLFLKKIEGTIAWEAFLTSFYFDLFWSLTATSFL
jgi:hypothetical protein